MNDLRRRQYVPLATHFATARTGTRIQQEFGTEGLGVWTCLLAAAKRSQTQGTVIWTSEADAWDRLGLISPPDSFTFEEFVSLLGRIKQARTRRIGRESHTTLTRFSEWNKSVHSQSEAARKRRKRAQNTADDTTDVRAPKGATEGEGEGETPLTPQRRRNRPVNGTNKAPTRKHVCPRCQHPFDEAHLLATHLEWSDCAEQFTRKPEAAAA